MQQRFAAFTPEPSSRSARPDLLYNLVVNTNVAVIENGVQREREYILSLGVIGAEWRRFRALPASIEALRLAVLMFLESVQNDQPVGHGSRHRKALVRV